ncbi:MAG: hypothetical protein LVR00_07990 [Rhabdochlamydiaceae bacterium]|jgi:hypothetical protein
MESLLKAFLDCTRIGEGQTKYASIHKKDDNSENRVTDWIASHPIDPLIYTYEDTFLRSYVKKQIKDLSTIKVDASSIHLIGKYLQSAAKISMRFKQYTSKEIDQLPWTPENKAYLKDRLIFACPTCP